MRRIDADSTSGRIGKATTTPLLEAVAARNESRVRELLESGVAPDDVAASRSPLIQAITSFNPAESLQFTCHSGIVRLLLENRADPNRADPAIGALPLQTAVDVGDLACARLILDAGGNVNGREKSGRTVLMAAVGAAARRNSLAILDKVLEWGAALDEQSDDGATALHEAVRIGSAEVAAELLRRGANACVRNHIEQTPLEMAVNLKRPAPLIDLLRQAQHSCLEKE